MAPADAGHDEHHQQAQRIEPQAEVHVQALTQGQPVHRHFPGRRRPANGRNINQTGG